MPVLLFKLRGAPEDEVEEVRALLHANNIDFYETHAGNWSIAMAAIWLRDDNRLLEARALLDAYQMERAVRMRSEYEAAKKYGKIPGLKALFITNPVIVLLGLMFILFVLYLSLAPFLSMRHWL